MQKLSFNIIGAGAIGHLWACFLNRNQQLTKLYTKHTGIEKTIEVSSPLGDFKQQINYSALSSWQSSDVVIISVKAHQLESLCQQLARKKMGTVPIILMMNGMGLQELVLQYLPKNPVLHASITHGALLQSNKLQHTGLGTTLLGNLSSNYPKEDFKTLIKILDTALPQVMWNKNHIESMNLKLLINAIINPITALHNLKNGEIIKNNFLIAEAYELLQELEPMLQYLLPNKTLEEVHQSIMKVALGTSKNSSSMRQDVKKQKETEIDFINGYLINEAKKHTISLPQNLQIIREIKKL
ncbi:ketopantoate reductase family protein [Aliikangiella sp. IMCC44359]|uniref:ketopantoate reductase family protein n=1 Tax=Aliikangiella sp. IMCC44359 TaxID=3459125 RepID=UPI00403B1FEB